MTEDEKESRITIVSTQLNSPIHITVGTFEPTSGLDMEVPDMEDPLTNDIIGAQDERIVHALKMVEEREDRQLNPEEKAELIEKYKEMLSRASKRSQSDGGYGK